jgi:predicted MFS family arabinose efflux permease
MNINLGLKRHTFWYLIASNFLLVFGFRIWQTMINNFAVEEIAIGPASIGWVQALREVPGLLGFLVGFLALLLSEMRIMALSVVMLGAGIFLTGQADNVPFLLIGTIVMSFGFHFFTPSNTSVVLMSVDEEQAPRTLGWLRSLNAVGAIVATGVVYVLSDTLGFRTIFSGVGGLIIIGGLILLLFGGKQGGLPSRRRIVLRRKYWLYYVLAFLMGSRRHIFTTFAIFLLVRKYGISVQTTAILFFVNSVMNVFTMQMVGKFVSRLGERLMLSVAFGLLAFVFLGYAFVTSLELLFVLFVLDNILFGFNLALTTYFQKIAVTREEITSNLAVQQTINHIAAIIVPVIGGAAWELFGSQVPFLAGVGIVLTSLILVQFMRIPERVIPEKMTI